MIIVQISDTHLAAPGQLTLGVADMAGALRRTVAHVNTLDPQPDVVLITGDITNDGTGAQTQHAAEILAGLHARFYVIGGNHDARETLWQVFGGGAILERQEAFISYRIDGFPLALIGLDSTIDGAGGAMICADRLAWLAGVLDDQPTVIFMHHPPIKCSVLETDQDAFVGVDEFASIVLQHPNIQRILCGHIHLAAHAAWAGTTISTAPSIGMALRRDLNMTRPSAFYLTPPAYLLHHWTPQNNLITHLVQVENGDGPHLF